MGQADSQDGSDGERPDSVRRDPKQGHLDVFRNPNAILLFPNAALPPIDWQKPWRDAGWTVSTCSDPAGIPDAIAHPDAKSLVAMEWPEAGDASSVDEMSQGLRNVIAALDRHENALAAASSATGGLRRRGDFLAHLAAVARSPAPGCWVLMAIRVDQLQALSARLDMTAIFDLEERITTRCAALLREDDTYTIWLELGFGVLVRRDDSEQVEALAARICKRIADEPFVVAGEPQALTASIGVALAPKKHAADSADRWFASAHAAQAIAFRHGGNRFDGVLTREFEPTPAERVLIIREWVVEAKQGDNVMLDFQPILPLASSADALYALHAKLRDYRAPLGGVYRNEFLPHARKAGAMVMIDRLSLFGAFEALEQERARGLRTRLIVPVEIGTLEGIPWRWLEAELNRHRDIADGLIVELEGNSHLEDPDNVKRIRKLRELGVRVGVADISGGLDRLPVWFKLPLDILRLQFDVVDAVSPEVFRQRLAQWRSRGRQVIVDAVEEASAMRHFTGLGVDYLCGPGLAAIGPRLDFDFS